MRPLDAEAQTLGERLRLLRRTQAVTMEMLMTATRVQRRYLEALEWGRYDELPDPMYTRNFIRSYARYLGADEVYFLDIYEQEVARSDLLAPHRLPRERVRQSFFFSLPQLVGGLAIGSVFLLFLIFLGGRILSVFAPPPVEMIAPVADGVVTVPYFAVQGRTEEGVEILVNGSTSVLHDDGSFAVEVPLRRGPNVVRVEARQRYSRPLILERVIVYDPPNVDNSTPVL